MGKASNHYKSNSTPRGWCNPITGYIPALGTEIVVVVVVVVVVAVGVVVVVVVVVVFSFSIAPALNLKRQHTLRRVPAHTKC